MRRYILLIVALFLSVRLFAQLEVKKGSFKEVPGFVNINPDPDYQTDDNDNLFAVIKVRTENITDKQRRDLRFESNLAVGIVLEYKTGEVWVYLTAKYADYLKISHPDFSSTEFTIPFDLQPKKGYEMTLVNKTGMVPEVDVYNYLVVAADQPNAAVYIDDVFEGEQFAQKSFMAGEKHTWRIECELYHTESGEATIPEKEGENITIEKTLRPAYGFLNVTSSPESGAIVYIDGKKVGQTPYKTDKLASGEHKVRVMKEMYSATEQTFTITDGNTTQAALVMSANFVNVTVTTDSESDIYIDNELKGKGTWTGRLGDGNHSFEARKASHRNSVENMKLTLGKDENIVIPNPTPIYGTLDVSTNPIGANIIIDGKNFGTTPRVLTNVLIGTHELKLEKDGCASVVKTITLDDKTKLTINEKLATISATPANPITPTATTTQNSNGVFSVSATKKVNFSKGNLQYQASTKTWRFAEHQWDIIGDDNENISSSYSGWIDLFGWGTGNNPAKSSTSSSDNSSFSDWGNNTISNGGGKNWFTLTKDEWVYVFNTRSTSSGIRYAKAIVNGVNGVILLPDNWSSVNYSLSNTNKPAASFSSNHISQSDWTSKLEANGAVFLPAAGWRGGTSVYEVGSDGDYWSATCGSSDSACSVGFYDGRLSAGDWSYRERGQSVRLVSVAEN